MVYSGLRIDPLEKAVLDGRQLALKVFAINLLMAANENSSILEYLSRQFILLCIHSASE